MARTTRTLLAAASALAGAACAEKISSSNSDGVVTSAQIAAAFSTSPVGFESTTSSFASTTSSPGKEFVPAGRDEEKEREGENGLAVGHDFMGGGLTLDLLGGRLGGFKPFEREHDDESSSGCAYANGITTCTSARSGITVKRTIAWTDVNGAAQSSRTPTTRKVVFHSEVGGARTTRNGAVTTTVAHTSDLAVVGLEVTSTQRTVDATASGKETTSGATKDGAAFTAVREVNDAISGVVIPIANGRPSYPTAGTVSRAMKVSLTMNGATKTSQRSEVITFDGSSTAKLVITKDGGVKTCRLPLPYGRPVCS